MATTDPDPDATAAAAETGAPLGVASTFELGQIAERLGVIGRGARNQFGDGIVIIAERVRDLAGEARRRLVADRLGDDAGTDDQRRRREDERQNHPTGRAGP